MKLMKWVCAALLTGCATQAAAAGSLADVSVFDRSEGRRLPVYYHEGRAWVVGKPPGRYNMLDVLGFAS